VKPPSLPGDLSAGQVASLNEYEELLRERAPRLGLVSEEDLPRLRDRHILDCLRARGAFREGDRVACDLGSGAGLPGLVLAIALPGVWFILAESRRVRAGFLELVVDRLRLPNIEVFLGRAENLEVAADVATSRAFGPIDGAWRIGAALLRPGGRLVYFAGDAQLAARARSITVPAPPAGVEILGGVANRPPLVIMTRG
jgi:16S rRNA (guanine527-N7)-methyltransferase